jgi:hypothetical protein
VLELVPDIPDDLVEQEYSHWHPDHTFVVSGPLPWVKRRWPSTPGRAMGRRQARCWVAATYGRFEELRHARRWAFRVIKPTAPGGRYTPPPGYPEDIRYEDKVVISVKPISANG